MLHIYKGSVKLSFWSDNASRTAETAITTVYCMSCQHHSQFQAHRLTHTDLHTENCSTTPQNRRAHAKATTEMVNATLPSSVFDVVADQRYFPSFLPTMDA